jgi:hypothetical protein
MARGGKRPGAGRPPGAATKRTREIADAAAQEGLTPLAYMLKILRDEEMDTESRFEAAKAAAPYMHPRLANVEMNANVAVSHEDALGELE